MQSGSASKRKRSEVATEKLTLLSPSNARHSSSYGSVGSRNKAPLEEAHYTPGFKSRIMGENMVPANLRRISATEVVLPSVKWYRRLHIPGLVVHRPSSHSNAIRTTKYTVINFLPKNLFEQFHRFANIYFLFIALLNFVPEVEAVGKEVAYVPLLVILGVTICKDIFEDYRRYRSDKTVNGKLCRVYDRGSETFIMKQWKNLRVGDFVKLLSDEEIPADILLLQSSDPGGLCYIETANIDGETNLKQRQVASGTFPDAEVDAITGLEVGQNFSPLNFKGDIYCEQPHKKIYDFNGYISTPDGSTIGINRNNLLLRGCVVRNTPLVFGVVVYAGHETKSMLNNSGPRIKRSKLERTINIDIIFQVVILVVLCLVGATANGVWISSLDGNITFFPFNSGSADIALESFVRFWTFLIILQVIVPISLYVTMEIVKLAQAYFVNWDKEMYYAPTDRPFQCRALNITEDLGQIQYVFSDKTGTLTENQMVFRCCSVGGSNYPHTLADELAAVHRSGQHGLANSQEIRPAAEEAVDFPEPPEKRTDVDPKLAASLSDPTVEDFFIVMAICNSVVVSSGNGNGMAGFLHSSIQNGNVVGADASVNKPKPSLLDLKYEAESPDEAALVHAARDYGYTLLSRSPNQCSLSTPDGRVLEYDVLHMLDFDSNRKCMSIIVRQKGHSEVVLYSKGADSVIYKNSAVLETVVFHESGIEDPDTISLPSHASEGDDGGIVAAEDPPSGGGGDGISATSDGGSGRTGRPISRRGSKMGVALMRDRTQSHLDDYAKIGLRTLCMAKRVLSEEEYDQWLVERHRAEVALEGREELLNRSAYNIESHLQLLGATGIEDKLQTGVPEAITSLHAAGLKVWVLTGDKQETAINIGFSSGLIRPDDQVSILNVYSLEECRAELQKMEQKLSDGDGEGEGALNNSDDSVTSMGRMDSLHSKLIRLGVFSSTCEGGLGDTRRVLVVDGGTLVYALDPSISRLFVNVAKRFHSVIGCRATPLQKAGVVMLIKSGLGQMTLAIGDGANDVSMIQKADVGVGIAGREGMQAVMASDFAMARFQFLVRLLLVHGHWSYARLARLILYFFYKNLAFALLLFWYQIFNGFSGSAPIDSINLLIFNLVYTSLPIMVVSVADQDLPAPVLLQGKMFYNQGRCSQLYTRLQFWLTVLDAAYQSAVVFFVAFGAYYLTDVGITEFGFLINTSIVVVVSLHLAVETMHWTVVNHVILWGSVIFTFIFNYIYCAIDTKQRIMDTLYVMQRASLRTEFWFVLLLTPAIALLPRIVAKIVLQEVSPTPVMAARARRRTKMTQIDVTEQAQQITLES